MALASGTRLGPYEVTAQIGVGGMGEVYRARDTKLDRDVAIKVLPEAVAADPDRIARFQREAKTLAALNHPNIAAIYGLEEADGIKALVMELVEGPTLADRIAQGALPLDEALAIAKQIAEALEAAHEQGIIHRDLKPANIKVRPDGTVKVLDFGLAKAMEPASTMSASASMSPTITTPAMTQAGMILGTAAYMSPEQAKGKPADRRSDVWAFGCVLFEMLTGRRAFEGDDVSDTLAAVLRGDPDWTALPKSTPHAVREAIRRCLDKDRRKRLHAVADVEILVEAVATTGAAGAPALVIGTRLRERAAWALVGAILIAVVAVWLFARQTVVPAQTVRFAVSVPEGFRLSVATGLSGNALSPDGRQIVFVAVGETDGVPALWLRGVDSLASQRLQGTENAAYPFWSPDSRRIGFFAAGSLKTVELSGGGVRTLCPAPVLGRGGTWNRDGEIVFASTERRGLFRVPDSGGTPTLITAPDESLSVGFYRFPSFLPDGRRFLYLTFPSNEIRLGSLDEATTAKVGTSESQALFVAPGSLLYTNQGRLVLQRFDADSGTLTGDTVPVVEQMAVDGQGYASVSVSVTGSLAYVTGSGSAQRTELTWFDRAGRVLGTVGPPGRYRNPALSPDGRQVAVELVRDDEQNRDIWLLELARGVLSRLTFDAQADVNPVWSPDGSRIVFASNRADGVFSLYEKPANGSASEEMIFDAVKNAVPYSWSPDGNYILHRYMNGGAFNTGVLTLGGERRSRLFQPVPFNQSNPRVSPDGRWMAYHSNESGRYEIYVQTFPTAGGKWLLSKEGGLYPSWKSDGREIFYYGVDGQLMSVPIRSGEALDVGVAVPLFGARMLNGPAQAVGFVAQYDVSSDGQRFLLNVPVEENEATSITVVLNWMTELNAGR